jgi:hypothetical protein
MPASQQPLRHITAHMPQANHAKFHNTPLVNALIVRANAADSLRAGCFAILEI